MTSPTIARPRARLLAGILLLLAAVSACDRGGQAAEDPKKLTREKAAQLLREALDGPVMTQGLAHAHDQVQNLLSAEQRPRYVCHRYYQGSASDAAPRCTKSAVAEMTAMGANCNEAQGRLIGAGLAELVFLANTRRLGGSYGHAHYCVALKTPELAKYEREGKFVVGERHVTEVTGMTEPAPTMGVTVSEVSFRLSRKANDLGRLTAGLLYETGKKPDEEFSGRAMLVLYDDGWRLDKNAIRLK